MIWCYCSLPNSKINKKSAALYYWCYYSIFLSELALRFISKYVFRYFWNNCTAVVYSTQVVKGFYILVRAIILERFFLSYSRGLTQMFVFFFCYFVSFFFYVFFLLPDSEEVFVSRLNRVAILCFQKNKDWQIAFIFLHFQRWCLVQLNEGWNYVRTFP